MKQSLAKNTAFLTAAYIIQKLFSFIYFTIIARWIGPEDIGKFVFAVSLATLLAVFIDLGLTNVLIRESAKFKDLANSYLNNLLTIKTILTCIIFIIGAVLISSLDKSLVTNLMIIFALGAMALDQFTHSFWGIFRGFQNM